MVDAHLKCMKTLNQYLLDYVIHDDDTEEYYKNLLDYYESNIANNPYDLKLFLYLIQKISHNHYRTTNFWNKIE